MSNQAGSYDAVHNALCQRIAIAHHDLLVTYGIEQVLTAIADVATSFESHKLEEIGTSDVSCWVKEVKEILERGAC